MEFGDFLCIKKNPYYSISLIITKGFLNLRTPSFGGTIQPNPERN